MPDRTAAPVMQVRPRALALGVLTVALTLLALRVLSSAGRVIGWTAMAAALAAILTPTVNALARKMPRGIALALVALLSLGGVVAVAYGLVGDIVQQTNVLRREAPRLAARVERSGRFAPTARDAHLSERVKQAVDAVPERLRGGDAAQAVRSATTRGLAFLAVSVLTMFFVLHGGRLVDGAARQVRDADRRALLERVGSAVGRRAVGYARGTLLMSAMAGAFAFVVARAMGIPGAAPLGVWVALWDVLPLAGAVLGALPVVALGAAIDPAKGAVLGGLFIAWQLVEYVLLQRPLERATVRVGPFLTAFAGFAGVELYGLAGGLLAIFGATIALVAVEEIAAAEGRVPRGHADE